jgi:heterodisulfide reductase subunit A
MNKRIGVFVCHCGINIAGTVKIPEVLKAIEGLPNVAVAKDHQYCCSDPGQSLIKETVEGEKLDAVVVACCSPTLHEPTFRKAVQSVGLNPYVCEIANIREQCSWVTTDKDAATRKAVRIIKTQIARVLYDRPLTPVDVPITRRAMVIGGGVAGIQAALDIASAGHEVVLVEKEPSIGGHMAQLSETFPTLDCSQCILTPKMVEVYQHPKVKLMTYSEAIGIEGFVGNFTVKVRRKPAYIDWDVCNGCGQCLVKCPGRKPSEFDRGTSKRKAVYRPFPQAVPNRPVIDASICVHFKTGRCSICADVCPLKAIRYDQKESFVEVPVGAIVLATGFELLDMTDYSSFGNGLYPDVIDGLQFERILSASGPTSGEVKRPSDGKVPKRVVFVQCAGSRDPENGKPYCSKVCCMYTAKHAMLYKHRVPDGDAIVFYIDVRTGGKDFEEFYKRATDEGVLYLRGKVSKIYRQGDKMVVWGADTLTGRKVQVECDLVVLANAMVPAPEAASVAAVLKAQRNEHGFFNEAHPKLRPVEMLTAGYFLAGAAQGPKDIPESVAQASGAACKVIGLFSQDKLYHEPPIAGVDEELCSGCGVCVGVCPYGARELVEKDVKGTTKKVIKVNEILCECCGACSSACPVGACPQRNLGDEQIQEMVKAGLEA